MKSLRTGLLAAVAIFALPSAAAAEELVPPDNSAVNQYTETFPTPGGDKEATRGKKRPTPAEVLGSRNAKKLAEQGAEGRKVATVAATTAPETVVTPAPEEPDAAESEAAAVGNSRGGGGGGANRPASDPPPASQQARGAPDAPREGTPSGGTNGSSGLWEVLAQATGTSSSGGLGLLLPLAILATAIWAVAATRRRTRRPAQ